MTLERWRDRLFGSDTAERKLCLAFALVWNFAALGAVERWHSGYIPLWQLSVWLAPCLFNVMLWGSRWRKGWDAEVVEDERSDGHRG